MDDAEQIAEQYLKNRGYTDIEYEPEGRDTFPDFLLNGQIGVEVRRLNISTINETGTLTSTRDGAHSVADNMRELLRELGPPRNGLSWFVRAEFRRPLIPWRKLKPTVERTLRAFLYNHREQATIDIAENFKLHLHQAARTFPDCFVDGAYDDLDNGAVWVDYERERNLKLCIEEKTRKRNRSQLKRTYSEWWLIFLDQIGYGSEFDCPEKLNIKHDWNRVILVHPRDSSDLSPRTWSEIG